tara:strand:+ start:1057 stop:1401 length:345 start_codon:yes stop_codon:yes gene_type:complete
MIYYAIVQRLSSGYKETVILNCAVSESSFLAMYEQMNNIVDDQYSYKVHRLSESDHKTLRSCSNHTDERQTMLFQFIDRGSILPTSNIVKESKCNITSRFVEEELDDFGFDFDY